MHLAQREALEQRPHGTHQHGRHDERGPEADPAGQRVAHVGPHHVEAGVCEIEDAHHAEDEGQPRAQHEQQQAVADSIEHGDDEELHEVRLSWLVCQPSEHGENKPAPETALVLPMRTTPHETGLVRGVLSISPAASSGSWSACWTRRTGTP
ncbi:hypothetical protein FQZ97_1090210 [compost metagenome]